MLDLGIDALLGDAAQDVKPPARGGEALICGTLGVMTAAQTWRGGAAGLIVGLALWTMACGGAGWLEQYPDIAAQARQQPGAFVEPARHQWDGLQTLGASYSMRITRGIGARSFDLYISMRRPESVDILVLAPTGLIEAYLRANTEQVGMFVREDEVLYAGPTSDDAFARALGFDLSAADAVAVLLGYGVASQRLPAAVARWDGKSRRIRVDYGERTSAWLHPVTRRFDRVVHRNAQGQVSAEMLEWTRLSVEAGSIPPTEQTLSGDLAVADLPAMTSAGIDLPSLIRLQVEPQGYGIRLRLVGEPAVNPDYAADAFDLQFLPGILVRPLEDLAREGGLFRRQLADQEQ